MTICSALYFITTAIQRVQTNFRKYPCKVDDLMNSCMGYFLFAFPGTDATHAEHIETIKNRNYVGEHNDRSLIPRELGMGLVEGWYQQLFAM